MIKPTNRKRGQRINWGGLTKIQKDFGNEVSKKMTVSGRRNECSMEDGVAGLRGWKICSEICPRFPRMSASLPWEMTTIVLGWRVGTTWIFPDYCLKYGNDFGFRCIGIPLSLHLNLLPRLFFAARN